MEEGGGGVGGGKREEGGGGVGGEEGRGRGRGGGGEEGRGGVVQIKNKLQGVTVGSALKTSLTTREVSQHSLSSLPTRPSHKLARKAGRCART